VGETNVNDILTISAPSSWYLREIPMSVKFSAEATNKINALISNQIVVNDYLENILVGSNGGTEPAPATLPMAVPSSPTGWSRDTSIANDQILAVSNSSGRATGGSWSLTGGIPLSTDGSHTHTTGNHTHDIAHSHVSVYHTHDITHTHNFIHTHTVNLETVTTGQSSTNLRVPTGRNGTYTGDTFTAFDATSTSDNHAHAVQHQHTPSTETVLLDTILLSQFSDEAAAVYLSSSGSSSVPTNDTLVSAGDHTHNVFGDSLWRPKYMNVIICRKD